MLSCIKNQFNRPPWFNFLKNEQNKKYYEHLENSGPYPPDTYLHSHHIIPRFCFQYFFLPEDSGQNLEINKKIRDFVDSPANLILLSVEDHRKAHQLLLEIYGDKRDAGAVKLLTGQYLDAAKFWKQAGAEATHKILKEKDAHFWSRDFQVKQARKSMAKEDALAIRRKAGEIGGRNKSLDIAIRKEDRILFSFNGEECLCIFNCQTGGDICRELNKVIPTKIQRVTPLLTGERKYAYGWTCKKIDQNKIY
jgi:hypothetical protein